MEDHVMPSPEELHREAMLLERVGPLAILDIARQFTGDKPELFEHETALLISGMNPDVARGMILGGFMIALAVGPAVLDQMSDTPEGVKLITVFRQAVSYARHHKADLHQMEEWERRNFRENMHHAD